MLVEEVYVLDEHQASLARTSGLPDDAESGIELTAAATVAKKP